MSCNVHAELQGGKAIVEEPGEEDASVSNHQPALDTGKASTNGVLTTPALLKSLQGFFIDEERLSKSF